MPIMTIRVKKRHFHLFSKYRLNNKAIYQTYLSYFYTQHCIEKIGIVILNSSPFQIAIQNIGRICIRLFHISVTEEAKP